MRGLGTSGYHQVRRILTIILAAKAMETAESDSHYSEQLIRLPKIGVNIEPPPVSAEVLERSDFGIPEGRIIYGAVQTLFKYLPQFDFLYIRRLQSKFPTHISFL